MNTLEKVGFREDIQRFEGVMQGMIERGEMETANVRLKHYFCPTADGRFLYARELWVAKDSVITGKIHRYPCLNFVMQGALIVASEEGQRLFKAPSTIVSPAGVKRAGWILANTIWTTVHLTSYGSEEELDKIEQEVISPSFAELGLIDSRAELERIEGQKL